MLYRRERNMQMLLPFGIFLGIGSIIALLVGERIVNWYAGLFMLQ
jgi:prepilin signal peptidase PulO-like enzyme (type II secretory pathway)